MRTTLTLEADVLAMLRAAMERRGVSFKQVVNDAIRAGLGDRAAPEPFSTATYAMGQPHVPLTHALRLAADMEDEEIIRKLSLDK